MAHKRAQSGRAQIVEIRRPIVDNQVERWFGWRSRRRNDGADCVSKRGGFFQPSEQRRRTPDFFRCEIIDYRTCAATDGENGGPLAIVSGAHEEDRFYGFGCTLGRHTFEFDDCCFFRNNARQESGVCTSPPKCSVCIGNREAAICKRRHRKGLAALKPTLDIKHGTFRHALCHALLIGGSEGCESIGSNRKDELSIRRQVRKSGGRSHGSTPT